MFTQRKILNLETVSNYNRYSSTSAVNSFIMQLNELELHKYTWDVFRRYIINLTRSSNQQFWLAYSCIKFRNHRVYLKLLQKRQMDVSLV